MIDRLVGGNSLKLLLLLSFSFFEMINFRTFGKSFVVRVLIEYTGEEDWSHQSKGEKHHEGF